MRSGGLVVVLATLGGCGFSPNGASSHDGGPLMIDAAHPGSDAAIDARIDARIDAGSGSAVARVAQDLLLGAGRLTVGTITVDVQLGAGPQPTLLTAGSATIEGQTVIQP